MTGKELATWLRAIAEAAEQGQELAFVFFVEADDRTAVGTTGPRWKLLGQVEELRLLITEEVQP